MLKIIKLCSGATFRATLLEISWNILKYKGNKKPILKGVNDLGVVKNSKNDSHVAVVRNINSVVVNNLFYKGLRNFEKLKNSKKLAILAQNYKFVRTLCTK